jgi:hypothetical protein
VKEQAATDQIIPRKVDGGWTGAISFHLYPVLAAAQVRQQKPGKKEMRKVIIGIVLTVAVASGGFSSYRYILSYLHDEREQEERRNIELAINSVPVNPTLPFALIIGDSISVSYTLPVKLQLEDIANVIRPMENCSSTLTIRKNLDRWLGQTNWSVIHFNAGLHDLEHVQQENIAPGKQIMVPIADGPRWISLETYRENLENIVKRLKKTNATLIFATTTPVPAGERNRAPEDVALYNEVALAVMQENGVLIDDLNSAVVESAYQFQIPQDVHFYEPGSQILAGHVAASIKAALLGRPSSGP